MREHATEPNVVTPALPVAAPPTRIPLGPSQVLALQRGAGNQAVARRLARSVAEPDAPQAAPAPIRIAAILHEGQYIAAGVDGCREALVRVAAAQGAEAATAWATRFFNMDVAQRASLEVQHGPELVAGTIAALRTAEAQFIQDNERFLMNFETRAGNVADELLTVSEEKIRAEQERLGGAAEVDGLRAAATALLPARRQADALARRSIDAQDELARAARTDPFHLDPSAREQAEAARSAWTEGERRFAELARAGTAEQPALAMYTTGGDAAAKLQSVAEGTDDPQVQLATKLGHIAEVRAALGGRFKPLKQPPVVRMTKQAMAVEPYQSRLVDDHIKRVQAAEEESQLMWSLIALGLGLVAALPTGGTSVWFAATVAGAGVGAAGISAYQAYNHVADAGLQQAGADTDMDKAHAISEGEPDYFWLALEVVGVVADVAAAGAAFKGLRAAMREAALEDLASLQRLARQCDTVRLSAAGRGRVFGEVMKTPVSFEQMLEVFRKLKPPVGEEKWVEWAHKMAVQMRAEKRIVELRPNEFVNDLAAFYEKQGLTRDMARRKASELYFDRPNTDGIYLPEYDVIVVRMAGTPELVASVFVHELTHRRQQMLKVLDGLTEFESEVSAFASQRAFLKLVPEEAIPDDYRWLRKATDDELRARIAKSYEIAEGDRARSETWEVLLATLRGHTTGR